MPDNRLVHAWFSKTAQRSSRCFYQATLNNYHYLASTVMAPDTYARIRRACPTNLWGLFELYHCTRKLLQCGVRVSAFVDATAHFCEQLGYCSRRKSETLFTQFTLHGCTYKHFRNLEHSTHDEQHPSGHFATLDLRVGCSGLVQRVTFGDRWRAQDSVFETRDQITENQSTPYGIQPRGHQA